MTTTRPAQAPAGLQLLRPGDEGYEEGRKGWNGAVDRHPAYVARCRGEDDVVAGVRLAADHDLLLAVRGGGHSIPGYSTCDGGLVLDLSLLKGVEVDPAARTARVQPGVLWRELDAACWEHGLATTGGEISDTGVAGLTLGGGIGWLSRRQGHACDALVGARLVTAGGEVLDVDEDSAPDLLWGLRGGGGNLGVVTEFRFRLQPTPAPLVLAQLHPAEGAGEALRAWRDLAEEAPDGLATNAVLLTAPPLPDLPPEVAGRPAMALTFAWWGDPAEGARLLARVPRTPVTQYGPMDYPLLQSMADASAPWGVPAHAKSHLLGALDDTALDALLERAWSAPSPLSHVVLRRLGGACGRVPADATAFAHRDAVHMITVAGLWEPGSDGSGVVAWCRELHRALTPWSRGAYSNHLDADEGGARVSDAYPPATYARLAALKRSLDPGNLFRLNVNVRPVSS